MDDGVWDFGNLRCEGPVCEDPLRPPNGEQISESYEQGSKVSFTCNKPGYIPINPTPIECVEQPECKVRGSRVWAGAECLSSQIGCQLFTG